jgi:hypothetical protein
LVYFSFPPFVIPQYSNIRKSPIVSVRLKGKF